MEVANGVSGVILEYPINAQLGSDLVTVKLPWHMDSISVMLIKPLGDHSVDGDIVILEDTPPSRKEMQ